MSFLAIHVRDSLAFRKNVRGFFDFTYLAGLYDIRRSYNANTYVARLRCIIDPHRTRHSNEVVSVSVLRYGIIVQVIDVGRVPFQRAEFIEYAIL